MRLPIRPLVTLAFFATSTLVSAESLYAVNAESLQGVTLFEQTLTEPMLVMVKPHLQGAEQGDVAVLEQCLWSVNVDFTKADVMYSAGKMICIGPKQEVLEAIPQGSVVPFGQCADAQCSSFNVAGNETVIMQLSEALQFQLQPRNERK